MGVVGTVHELKSQKLWSFSGMVETVILGIIWSLKCWGEVQEEMLENKVNELEHLPRAQIPNNTWLLLIKMLWCPMIFNKMVKILFHTADQTCQLVSRVHHNYKAECQWVPCLLSPKTRFSCRLQKGEN